MNLNAPKEIIKQECVLVLRVLTGGSRFSTIKYLCKEFIYYTWNHWTVKLLFLLCRLNLVHQYEEYLVDLEDESREDIELRCAFCDKVKE